VILKAIEKDPQARYQTAVDLQRALEETLQPGRSSWLPVVATIAAILSAAVLLVTNGDRILDVLRQSENHGVAGSSIAQAPFKSTTPDSGGWARGITDDLDDSLGQLLSECGVRPEELHVIPARSMLKYQHSTKDLRQICSETGAAYVLDGSLQRAGDRI